MAVRTLAASAGVLGGLAWLARLVVDSDPLAWAGLALVGLACAAGSARLVSSGAPALRTLVTVAFLALVGSLWWLAHDAASGRVGPEVVDAAVGAVAVLVGVLALSRRRGMGRHSGRLGTG